MVDRSVVFVVLTLVVIVNVFQLFVFS